eukprot:EG_transcript_35268
MTPSHISYRPLRCSRKLNKNNPVQGRGSTTQSTHVRRMVFTSLPHPETGQWNMSPSQTQEHEERPPRAQRCTVGQRKGVRVRCHCAINPARGRGPPAAAPPS